MVGWESKQRNVEDKRPERPFAAMHGILFVGLLKGIPRD